MTRGRTRGAKQDSRMRYYALNDYLQDTFGEKVYKIALNGGFTCPNRDGTLDTRGCIFCSGAGSRVCREGGGFDHRSDRTGKRAHKEKNKKWKVHCVFSGIYQYLCPGPPPSLSFYGGHLPSGGRPPVHCHQARLPGTGSRIASGRAESDQACMGGAGPPDHP